MTTRPAGTESFALNQTMLRIRDPKPSLAFYRDVLGMTLLQQLDFEEMRFSLYFLAYLGEGETIPQDPAERARFIFERETTLELTHNWGPNRTPTSRAITMATAIRAASAISGSASPMSPKPVRDSKRSG